MKYCSLLMLRQCPTMLKLGCQCPKNVFVLLRNLGWRMGQDVYGWSVLNKWLEHLESLGRFPSGLVVFYHHSSHSEGLIFLKPSQMCPITSRKAIVVSSYHTNFVQVDISLFFGCHYDENFHIGSNIQILALLVPCLSLEEVIIPFSGLFSLKLAG